MCVCSFSLNISKLGPSCAVPTSQRLSFHDATSLPWWCQHLIHTFMCCIRTDTQFFSSVIQDTQTGHAFINQFVCPAALWPYLPVQMVVCLIVPFLKSYDVIFITCTFCNYAIAYNTCHPGIISWYDRFVYGPVQRIVRTSNRTVVYADLELRVHRLVSNCPTSQSAVTNAVATI